MAEKKRSIERQKEIDDWFEKVKPEAEKQHTIEYEKEVLKDAMKYCDEEIELDRWTK